MWFVLRRAPGDRCVDPIWTRIFPAHAKVYVLSLKYFVEVEMLDCVGGAGFEGAVDVPGPVVSVGED